MNANAQLAQQLQNWIGAQLAAGKSEQALIDMMIAQQVTPAVAIHTMRQYKALHGRAITDAAAPYEYDMPRLPPSQTLRAAERDIPVVARILRPRITLLDEVLSAAECELLIRCAEPLLQPLPTPAHAGIETAQLPSAADALIATLAQRLAELMHTPLDHAEPFEVRYYGIGASEPSAHDFLAADDSTLNESGQRVASLLIFLNEAAEGGAVLFPEMDVELPPKCGAGIYFDYCNSKGQLDTRTLRASTAVQQGEQWVLIARMRAKPLVTDPSCSVPASTSQLEAAL